MDQKCKIVIPAKGQYAKRANDLEKETKATFSPYFEISILRGTPANMKRLGDISKQCGTDEPLLFVTWPGGTEEHFSTPAELRGRFNEKFPDIVIVDPGQNGHQSVSVLAPHLSPLQPNRPPQESVRPVQLVNLGPQPRIQEPLPIQDISPPQNRPSLQPIPNPVQPPISVIPQEIKKVTDPVIPPHIIKNDIDPQFPQEGEYKDFDEPVPRIMARQPEPTGPNQPGLHPLTHEANVLPPPTEPIPIQLPIEEPETILLEPSPDFGPPQPNHVITEFDQPFPQQVFQPSPFEIETPPKPMAAPVIVEPEGGDDDWEDAPDQTNVGLIKHNPSAVRDIKEVESPSKPVVALGQFQHNVTDIKDDHIKRLISQPPSHSNSAPPTPIIKQQQIPKDPPRSQSQPSTPADQTGYFNSWKTWATSSISAVASPVVSSFWSPSQTHPRIQIPGTQVFDVTWNPWMIKPQLRCLYFGEQEMLRVDPSRPTNEQIRKTYSYKDIQLVLIHPDKEAGTYPISFSIYFVDNPNPETYKSLETAEILNTIEQKSTRLGHQYSITEIF